MSYSHGICQVAISPVRADARDQAEIVTQLLFGDYVKVLDLQKPWAHIYFPADDYEGWIDFKQIHFISETEYENGVNEEHELVKTGILKVNGHLGDQHIIFGSNLPFLDGNSFKLGDKKYTIEEPVPAFNDSFVDTALRYD